MTHATTTPRVPTRGVAFLVLVMALVGCVKPPRERSSEEIDRGYPTCGEAQLPEGEVVVSGALRSGPVMPDQTVVETFEVRRRGCVEVFRGRQTWDLATTDLDVVYDAETLLPLRVWKRVGSPGGGDTTGIGVRRFELRDTDRVALSQRTPLNELEHWLIRGAIPRAVIGPGRGLLTMWIRRARLPEGGRLREPALDIRVPMEVVRDVTLLRLADREVETLGRRVRVYTIYGREPFYADENDVVIGDMMGLVPASMVHTPPPQPRIPLGEPDPAAPL